MLIQRSELSAECIPTLKTEALQLAWQQFYFGNWKILLKAGKPKLKL